MKKADDFLNSLGQTESGTPAPEPSKAEGSAAPASPPSPPAKKSPSEKKAAKLAKKEARKAKKAAKRAKRDAKRNIAVLYIPEKMQGFRFSVPIGYLFRFFAIAFSVFGVLWLFCDAFKLTEISAGNLLLYCFGAVTAFSLIFIGKWFILAGVGVIGAYIGLFFLICGNPLTFFVSGVEEVINRMMTRLTEAGFAAFGTVNLPDFGGLSYSVSREQTLAYGGIFALATVLALIFAAFSAKRTRLLPMLITGGGLCTICFTYNLCETNWGIACVLAGLCSAAVLAAYDKTYKAHKHSKKSRAYSGYSAALAGLLALVILLLPASGMSEPWGEISFIAKPMNEARTILTTLLTGGNPAYNKMNSLSDKRSNALEEITFEQVKLFEVNSYSKRPVYLRSWIAKDFDYGENAWYQLDSNDYDEMTRELRHERLGFTGDQITYDRYTLLDPNLSVDSITENLTVNNLLLGHIATFIDIDYVNNSGLLYLLPSTYVPEAGLLEFESRTESYRDRYDLYSDGMYTSSRFNLFKDYSAIAVVPNYQIADYGKMMDNTIRYLDLLLSHANDAANDQQSVDEQLADFRTALDEAGLRTFTTDVFKTYLELPNTRRSAWLNQYSRLYNEYTEYVRGNYLDTPDDSEGLNTVYAEIADEIAAAETDHDKIMTVIDYLATNYSYTLAPTISEDRQYQNDLDYFLLEGKEGYCVQFATAAALLLREAGYPARYVQGYFASYFENTSAAGGHLTYTAQVLDEDAHAWVEVYIDGLGWRVYETTPEHYEKIYYSSPDDTPGPSVSGTLRPPQSTSTPITSTPTATTRPIVTTLPAQVETTVTTQPGDDTQAGFTIDLIQLLKVLATVALIALAAALLIWQIRRANKIAAGRTYFIDRAEYGSFEEKSDFDHVAGVLCDSIYEVHHIIGNRPKQGELPTEFAARIDRGPIDDSKRALRMYNRLTMLPATMSEITRLIEKQEFGKVMNRSELAVLGSYLRALIASEYRSLPIWKKIWYRYIRFMI